MLSATRCPVETSRTQVCQLLASAGTAVFVAARDIEQAEELCISYIDATATVAARQQQLQWGYGFTCKCHLCLEELQSNP